VICYVFKLLLLHLFSQNVVVTSKASISGVCWYIGNLFTDTDSDVRIG